jgi:zinc D-Ala-D-Ala carboxypeptidase
MPLAANILLAPHFLASELGADDPGATDAIISNLRLVAAWLEKARAVLGVPLEVTSGFRTWLHNAAIGGSPTSDHPNGLAADFIAQGTTPYQVYLRLQAAAGSNQLPPFDQIIFYAKDDHVHIGLGPKMRGEVLIQTTEGDYTQLAGDSVSLLRGYL